MSTFGRIAGVWTVFVTSTLEPEVTVALNVAGSTGAPKAKLAPNVSADANVAPPIQSRTRLRSRLRRGRGVLGT